MYPSILKCRPRRNPALVILFCCGIWIPVHAGPTPNLQFTVEVLSPHTSTTTLIETNADWRFFKGSTEPNAGWDTAEESFLGSSWKSGPGGFGYGATGLGTTLGDMQNGYSTVYIRSTFTHNRVLDPQRLRLRINYNDGFVAFLDGNEFARANSPGQRGQWPPHDSAATAPHDSGGAPETYYFPPDFPTLFPHDAEYGPRLAHILAVQGLNRFVDDPQFVLTVGLYMDNLFTSVDSDTVDLAGNINLPGAAEVRVNGDPAALDTGAGRWTKTLAVQPGMNRLAVEAYDCAGRLLGSRTFDLVANTTSTAAGGNLSGDTTWDPSRGAVRISGGVKVPSGATLTITAGTTVLFGPGSSLVTTGGAIDVQGTAQNPVFFLPADGLTPWGGIGVSGPGSTLTMHFGEVVAGGVYTTNRAQGTHGGFGRYGTSVMTPTAWSAIWFMCSTTAK